MGFFITLLLGVLLYILYRRTNALTKRLEHVEECLKNSTAQTVHATHQKPIVQEQNAPRMGAGVASVVQKERESQEETKIEKIEPGLLERFFTWLSTDWLMKLGGFLIILGMAWFVNYAFAEEWIGPMGRIGLGLIFATGVLALGRYRMTTFASQGSILMFVGALIAIFTVWVGQTPEYGFFTQGSALILMFLVSSVLGVMSILFHHKPLAYANVLLGAVAPLLVASHEPSMAALFTYLLVLAVGAVWVAGITGWRGIVFLSLGIVSLYSLPFIEDALWRGEDVGLMFCFIFTALYFVVSILSMRKIQKVIIADLLTAILSGMYLLLWILVSAEKEWQSLLLVAWTMVFALGAFTAVRLGAKISYFFTYTGVGVILLGAATAVELDGPTLVIAFILEAVLVILLGYIITRDATHLWLLGLPSIVPLALSVESMGSYSWRSGIFHSDGAVLYLIIAATVLLAMYFHSKSLTEKQETKRKLEKVRNISAIVGGVYATIVIWLVSTSVFTNDMGSMVALFIYTLIALGFYISSKRTGEKWHRTIGAIYFGIVMARLLFVEVWDMDLLFRVITFMVIGVLVVSVAWFEKSKSFNKSNTSSNK